MKYMPCHTTHFTALAYKQLTILKTDRHENISHLISIVFTLEIRMNKNSAVAEMGDRDQNRHGSKRGGCCAPFAVSSKNSTKCLV